MKTPPLLPIPLLILTAIALLVAIIVTTGCASMDYAWQQTRQPSIKPWLYITVSNVDRTCRDIIGLEAVTLGQINGCATWKPIGCEIYLQSDSPSWVKSHEERHCEGWVH